MKLNGSHWTILLLNYLHKYIPTYLLHIWKLLCAKLLSSQHVNQSQNPNLLRNRKRKCTLDIRKLTLDIKEPQTCGWHDQWAFFSLANFPHHWHQSGVLVCSTTCLIDVFWGQPIKRIHVVSTSEFHECWWNDGMMLILFFWNGSNRKSNASIVSNTA